MNIGIKEKLTTCCIYCLTDKDLRRLYSSNLYACGECVDTKSGKQLQDDMWEVQRLQSEKENKKEAANISR